MAAWQPRFPCLTSPASYQRRHARHAHHPSPLERAQSHADQMRWAARTHHPHGHYSHPPQLHPAPRQRCPTGLHDPRVPFAVLAPASRRCPILLPVQSWRHLALHHLLDLAACWRHPPHRRPVGVHRAMAQLEADMDHAAPVCRNWVYRGVDRWRHSRRAVSPATRDPIMTSQKLTVHRLGGVYQSGYFEMSTWIPFVWGAINAMVLILSSFAIYGGL
jgi:hypothetical protein